MCVCNGSEDVHCKWHLRIMHLYDVATEMTQSDLYKPHEVLEALEDIAHQGEWPMQAR